VSPTWLHRQPHNLQARLDHGCADMLEDLLPLTLTIPRTVQWVPSGHDLSMGSRRGPVVDCRTRIRVGPHDLCAGSALKRFVVASSA
jgi:hypothetical protein